MSRHPSVKWAQRSDNLFITVQLPDAQDVKLKIEPEGKFFFSATSGVDKIPYEVELDLLDKVIVEESKASTGSRSIQYIVKKAENKWWSRLIKQTGKPPVFLTVDWDKWIDEDEEFTSKGKPLSLQTPILIPCHYIFAMLPPQFSLTNYSYFFVFFCWCLGAPEAEMGDMGFDFPNLNLGGGGFDGPAPEMDDDDEDDTEDENAEEAPSAEKEVASASGEADTKKT